MVGWGLIGAAQGLGKGLASVGEDLEKRRAAAIEYAKKEAIEEARLQQQALLAQQRQSFDTAQTIYREEQANARADAGIASREGISQQQIAGRAKLQDKIIGAQRDLATLRGTIQRSNDAASQRLREQLGPKVHAVAWDNVDAKGYGTVVLINKDGTLTRTNERLKVPESSDGIMLNSGSSSGSKIDFSGTQPITVAPLEHDEDED